MKGKWIVPDEIQSAAEAASEMMSVVNSSSGFWFKQLAFALIPLVVGGVFGWVYITCVPEDKLANLKELVLAFITIVTVLAGFIVTLMLFTGRTQGAENLTLDNTESYIEKLIFLQFTQVFTLVVHVICILLSMAWLLAFASGASSILNNVLFSLCIAFMALSMVRTLLMPFQIFEVHLFELSVLRQEKRDKFKEKNDFYTEIESSSDDKK